MVQVSKKFAVFMAGCVPLTERTSKIRNGRLSQPFPVFHRPTLLLVSPPVGRDALCCAVLGRAARCWAVLSLSLCLTLSRFLSVSYSLSIVRADCPLFISGCDAWLGEEGGGIFVRVKYNFLLNTRLILLLPLSLSLLWLMICDCTWCS